MIFLFSSVKGPARGSASRASNASGNGSAAAGGKGKRLASPLLPRARATRRTKVWPPLPIGVPKEGRRAMIPLHAATTKPRGEPRGILAIRMELHMYCRNKAGSNSRGQAYEENARKHGMGYNDGPNNLQRLRVHRESGKVVARMLVCSIRSID